VDPFGYVRVKYGNRVYLQINPQTHPFLKRAIRCPKRWADYVRDDDRMQCRNYRNKIRKSMSNFSTYERIRKAGERYGGFYNADVNNLADQLDFIAVDEAEEASTSVGQKRKLTEKAGQKPKKLRVI
jgi:hypothetical protein